MTRNCLVYNIIMREDKNDADSGKVPAVDMKSRRYTQFQNWPHCLG